MIIKYKFLSTLADEVTEVEVNDELGRLIEQMESDEHNLERAETRRHIYISQLEEKGCYIADDRVMSSIIRKFPYRIFSSK